MKSFAGTVFDLGKLLNLIMNLLKSFHFRLSFFLFLSVYLMGKILSFSRFPDEFYPGLYAKISKGLQSLSRHFAFSLGDIFYVILGIFILIGLIQIFRSIRNKDSKSIYSKIAQSIYFLTGFYVVFKLVWGFNYDKRPIVENYHTEEIKIEELKNLAEIYFIRSVFLRASVQEDEKGVFKSGLNKKELLTELENSQLKVRNRYPEIKLIATTSPNLKPSLFSTVFSYLGVSGYFIPFTAEAQYNTNQPETKLLFTKMHETAHQWGFGAENEANFVGYLLGKESTSLDLNYVSNYKALRSILNRILLVDPVYVQVMLIRYSDGMKRDRNHEKEILEKYRGKGDEAFSLMNEAFLRLNNQEGLESYGRFVELLVGFNRKYTLSE